MTTKNIRTTTRKLLAGLAVAAGLGLAAGSAQAGDVFWSIGMAQPGIHIGVSNLPAPVIVAPAPVVVHPRPVYVPPPRVVYVPPRPVYYGYGYGRWNHERWDDRRDRREHDRWDGRRGADSHGGSRGGPELHMGTRR